MPPLILAFLQNLILPLALVYGYGLVLRCRTGPTWGRWGGVVVGLLFGAGAVLCMLMPLQLAEGVTIDNRNTPVVLAGPFGGPLAAVVASVLAGSYRWSQGGVGALPGILALLSSGALGLLLSQRWSARLGNLRLRHTVLVGLLMVGVTLPWTLLLPAAVDPIGTTLRIALPIGVIYPLATFVIGGLLLQVERQHRMGDDLRDSEDRFRQLFTHAPDAIFVADPDTGMILDVNPRGCALLGRDRHTIVGTHQSGLHPSHDEQLSRETFRQHGEQSRSGTTSTATQTMVVGADGERIPVEIVAQVMTLGGRQAQVGFFRDLRERQRAERALAAATAHTERIVRTVDAVILGLDGTGVILRANPAAERLLGRSLAALLGQDFVALAVPVERFPEVAHAFGRLFASGEPRDIEGGLLRGDGSEAQVTWRCSLVEDPGDALRIIVIGLDVTRQKALEERVHHAEKLHVVGQLAGGIAHDFNNQLQIITGHVDLLRHGVDAGRRDAILATVQDSCRYAADLTAKLLAFSRKAAVRRDDLDLNQIVHAAHALITPGLGARVRIVLNLTQAPLPIRGDAASLQGVLFNLAFNARDAMPDGGELTLTTACRSGPTGSDSVSSPQAELTVQDTGCGMTPVVLARIFEPFFTTKPIGRGTGLGLAAVYGTVQEHGGTIAVRSTPGQGTMFTLSLPLLEATRCRSSCVAQMPVQVRAARIIIIDDEPAIRDLMSGALQSAGHHVRSFADGAAALAVLRADLTSIDLVIVDLNMPGLSGVDLISEMVVLHPNLPIVVCTGHGPKEVAAVIRDLDAITVITKPFALAELITHCAQRLRPAATDASGLGGLCAGEATGS